MHFGSIVTFIFDPVDPFIIGLSSFWPLIYYKTLDNLRYDWV